MDTGDHGCASPNESRMTDPHTSTEGCPGGYVHIVINSAIVVNSSAGVDDAMTPDRGSRLNHNSGADE